MVRAVDPEHRRAEADRAYVAFEALQEKRQRDEDTARGGIKHLPVSLALTALQSGRLEAARTYAEASVELAQRDDAKESTEWIKGTRC
jgi:hypothetical protein